MLLVFVAVVNLVTESTTKSWLFYITLKNKF